MKKILIMLLLVLALCVGSAAEGNSGFPEESGMKSAVQGDIPRDSSTRAFPVSSVWAIYPEDGSLKKFLVYTDNDPEPFEGYVVPEGSVRLRIEITAEDDVSSLQYVDTFSRLSTDVASLLDPEGGVFVYDQIVPGPADRVHYADSYLFDRVLREETGRSARVFLVSDEAYISELMDGLAGEGAVNPRWEYTEAVRAGDSGPQAYIIHVVDQDSNPVEEVIVNFCTDTACTPRESDGNGLITFTGTPDIYHVQIVDAPEGYSYDEDYELYTAGEYGEWILRIRKD